MYWHLILRRLDLVKTKAKQVSQSCLMIGLWMLSSLTDNILNNRITNHIVVIGTVQDNLSIVAKSITNKPLEETAGIHPIYPLKEKH